MSLVDKPPNIDMKSDKGLESVADSSSSHHPAVEEELDGLASGSPIEEKEEKTRRFWKEKSFYIEEPYTSKEKCLFQYFRYIKRSWKQEEEADTPLNSVEAETEGTLRPEKDSWSQQRWAEDCKCFFKISGGIKRTWKEKRKLILRRGNPAIYFLLSEMQNRENRCWERERFKNLESSFINTW